MNYEKQITDLCGLIQRNPEAYVRSIEPAVRTILFQTCQTAQREGLLDDLDPIIREVYLNNPDAFKPY